MNGGGKWLDTLRPSKRGERSSLIKRQKKRALRPGMMVMIQDSRKLDFPSKFDAVWLGPYLVREVLPNNSMQLEILNGEASQHECPEVGTRNTKHE